MIDAQRLRHLHTGTIGHGCRLNLSAEPSATVGALPPNERRVIVGRNTVTSTKAPGPALPLVLPSHNNPDAQLRHIFVVSC